MKQIYIVTGDFPPSSKVGALRPFRLAKHLSNSGWQVDIITKHSNSKFSHNQDLLNELNSYVRIHYLPGFKNATNRRAGSTYFPGKELRVLEKFLARGKGAAVDVLSRYVKPDREIVNVPRYVFKFLAIYKKNKKSVVLTTSPPHSIHLVGAFISRFIKIPHVIDFRDPWDGYLERGKNEIVHPVDRFLERLVVKQSTAVVSTTKQYNENLIARHFDIKKTKFQYVTNCYDVQKTGVAAEKAPDKFIISYTGIFYSEKDPFTFFRALRSWFDRLREGERELIENTLEVKLIGAYTRHVANVIERMNLSKVIRFIERVPHEEAVRLTRMSDMALICAGIGEKSRPGWLPSKLIEYLGCNIPILAICREGEIARVIRETNSGYVVTSENHQLIQSILENEIHKKFFRNHDTTFSFQGIEQFQESAVMGKFSKILDKIVEVA